MQSHQLNLKMEQITVVLQCLAQGPYFQVEPIIREITSQVRPQIVTKEAEFVANSAQPAVASK
jgi:hypothetical protein